MILLTYQSSRFGFEDAFTFYKPFYISFHDHGRFWFLRVALWCYKSVQDSGHTGWFEIISASLSTDLSHAPVNGVCFSRCAFCTRTRTGCFAAAVVVAIAVVLRLVVARCSWCWARMRTRPMTGRRTVQKLEKPSEHTLACTALRNPANPVVPLRLGTVRLSVRSWPSEHTMTGPGDAIAIHERQSHPRRFKNATFPSPEAIRNPIWQKRDTGSITPRTTLSDSIEHATSVIHVNRYVNRTSPIPSRCETYTTLARDFSHVWVQSKVNFFEKLRFGIIEFSNLFSRECDNYLLRIILRIIIW